MLQMNLGEEGYSLFAVGYTLLLLRLPTLNQVDKFYYAVLGLATLALPRAAKSELREALSIQPLSKANTSSPATTVQHSATPD